MRHRGPMVVMLLLALSAIPLAATEPVGPPEIPFDQGDAGVDYLSYFAKGGAPEGKPIYLIGPDAGYSLQAQGGQSWLEWVGWLAVEREEGKWDWDFFLNDRTTCHIHDAGVETLPMPQFPPKWYWEGPQCVPMQCLEHGEKVYCLSLWAPSTLEAYERFLKAMAEAFRHRKHKFDAIRVPITADYGEGNYPLGIWAVPPLHCHAGWWCGDPYARADFRSRMMQRYGTLGALNRAWHTQYGGVAEIGYPGQGAVARHVLDFVHWYHDSLTAFAAKTLSLCSRIFPDTTLYCALGGGWPSLHWGMEPSALAKVASKFRVTANPASMNGSPFHTMAFASAYTFYGLPMATEPAGKLTADEVFHRIFTDASVPVVRYYDYGENYARGKEHLDKYRHLFGTCGSAARDVAVYLPTATAFTRVPQGFAGLRATVEGAGRLRDVADYDVIDDPMILDGALDKHKVLVVFEVDLVERAVVTRIAGWVSAGGVLITPRPRNAVLTPEGDPAPWARLARSAETSLDRGAGLPQIIAGCGQRMGNGWTFCLVQPLDAGDSYLRAVRDILYGYPSFARRPPCALLDPEFDGVLTTVMSHRILLQNRGQRDVTLAVDRFRDGIASVGAWTQEALAGPVTVPAMSIVALGPGTPPRRGPERRASLLAPEIPQQSSELPEAELGAGLLPAGFALGDAHLEGLPAEAGSKDGLQLSNTFVTLKGVHARDCLVSVCFRADDAHSVPEVRVRTQGPQSYYAMTFDGVRHWGYLTWANGGERHTLHHPFVYWTGGKWYHLALGLRGPELTCCVNGIKVSQVRHETIPEGGIQIGATGGRVTFRDLQMRAWGPAGAGQ